MSTIKEIKQLYEDCLNTATLWLNHNAYAVNHTGAVFCPKKEDDTGDGIVEATDTFHFWDWPQRDKSPERIDIVASMAETISLDNRTCKKARLRVYYYRIDGKEAIPTESVHYDYDCPPDTKHPICHVQNSNSQPSEFPESFTMHKIRHARFGDRCHNVRIPSAFVNLPGLFAILAADHMSEAHWREFMDHCRLHFSNIPPIAEHAVVDQAKKGLCAWDWYKM